MHYTRDSSQLTAPAALSQWKQPRCLLDRSTGALRVGLEAAEEKSILVLPETKLQFGAHSAQIPGNTTNSAIQT